jgi:hypothetical protein
VTAVELVREDTHESVRVDRRLLCSHAPPIRESEMYERPSIRRFGRFREMTRLVGSLGSDDSLLAAALDYATSSGGFNGRTSVEDARS